MLMCRFFISAPGVFHVGVDKKVFIQVGKSHLHKTITVYLEHETTNSLMSEKKTVVPTEDGKVATVELMVWDSTSLSISKWFWQNWVVTEPNSAVACLQINRERFSRIPQRLSVNYLNLVAEGLHTDRRTLTRVLVSKRSSNIFIQTDQPMYSPSQKGNHTASKYEGMYNAKANGTIYMVYMDSILYHDLWLTVFTILNLMLSQLNPGTHSGSFGRFASLLPCWVGE